MNNWQPDKIIDLLKSAAAIAMTCYDAPSRELKQDFSIVTVADKEIEALFSQALNRPEQGSYLIGEETIGQYDEEYIQQALQQTAWIVDPIDGTAPYANHIPTWGISIGFMQDGELKEGAIYMPATGEIFVSNGEAVYFGRVRGDDWSFSDLTQLKVEKRKLDGTRLVSLSQMISKKGRFLARNPVHAVCSCVYSIGHVMLGDYVSYLATVKLWDLAGAWPLLHKCGLTGEFYTSRQPLSLKVNSDNFILEPGNRRRWYARDHIVFADSKESVDFMINNLEMAADSLA